MANFTPDEKIIKIMKNFASINPSMAITPEKLEVINNAKSIVARYIFDPPYDFEPFGLYDTMDTLAFMGALGKSEIEVKDKYINIIGTNNDKVTYNTIAPSLAPKVPLLEDKFVNIPLEFDFLLTADKLAIIENVIKIARPKYMFFETDSKRIRLTVGDDILPDSSEKNYDICITDNISVNCCANIIKIPITDLLILSGEYEIKINNRIAKWSNLNGVTYYISTSI